MCTAMIIIPMVTTKTMTTMIIITTMMIMITMAMATKLGSANM